MRLLSIAAVNKIPEEQITLSDISLSLFPGVHCPGSDEVKALLADWDGSFEVVNLPRHICVWWDPCWHTVLCSVWALAGVKAYGVGNLNGALSKKVLCEVWGHLWFTIFLEFFFLLSYFFYVQDFSVFYCCVSQSNKKLLHLLTNESSPMPLDR